MHPRSGGSTILILCSLPIFGSCWALMARQDLTIISYFDSSLPILVCSLVTESDHFSVSEREMIHPDDQKSSSSVSSL